jgi:hypothetical protein
VRHVLTFLLLLVSCLPVLGADVPIVGADKPIKKYGMAKLSVKIEPGDQVIWRVGAAPGKTSVVADRETDNEKCRITAEPGSSFLVEVTVVNFDKKKLDVGQSPLFFEGEPDPVDPPGPKPPGPKPPIPPSPDGTSPFPDTGLRVLIVIPGKDQPLTQNQFDIIYGGDARDFLDATVGNDNYRIYPSTTNVDTAPKVWKDAFMRKRPPPELPWVLVGNGKTGYEGPLPKDIMLEQFKAMVTKHKP